MENNVTENGELVAGKQLIKSILFVEGRNFHMNTASEYADYLMSCFKTDFSDPEEKNKKVQLLLIFADIISYLLFDEKLFDNEIYIFEDFCVVKSVYDQFKNNQFFLTKESSFSNHFTDQEYQVLEMTLNIFEKSDFSELKDILHEFDFWNKAYMNGNIDILMESYLKECDMEIMKNIVDAYIDSCNENISEEVMNGVTFYSDDQNLLKENHNLLTDFALSADDDAYTVCKDGNHLLVY